MLTRAVDGLLGIGERAALFQGTFTAGRLPSGGWRMSVTLRLPELAGGDPLPQAVVWASLPAPVAR